VNDSPTPFDTPNSAPSTQIATRRPLDLSRPNADGASNLNAAPFSVPDDEAGAGGGALRQTLAMLRRRLKAILATLVCVTIAALVFLSMVPTVYESVATLQVHTAPIEAGDSQSRDLPVLADLSGATQSRSMETQLAILKSNAIQQGALKRLSPRARNEAAKYFDMSIEAVGDTDLIALTSRSFDRYTSASLSNEFCKEYMQLSRSKNRGQLQTFTSKTTASSTCPMNRRIC